MKLISILSITLGLCAGPLFADAYDDLRSLSFGSTNAAMRLVLSQITSATPEELHVIEGRMLSVLQAPDATIEARRWICRTLRMMGSERSVPALAAMLKDNELAPDALFALRSIPGNKVDTALRKAIPQAQGRSLAGVIQTLGARRDKESVAAITPLASSLDPQIAEAALYALGQIATTSCLEALEKATPPPALSRYRAHALLLCAESQLIAGKAKEAARVARQLSEQSGEVGPQCAALRLLCRADAQSAGSLLRSGLRSDQEPLRAAAAKALCEIIPGPLAVPVLAEFASWPVDSKVLVLGLVETSAALPVARAAASDANPEVSTAALGALGRLGTSDDLPVLLRAAALSGPPQVIARVAVRRLRGKSVDAALRAAARSGATEERCEAIRAVSARQTKDTIPMLFALCADGKPEIRLAAAQALGEMATPADLLNLLREIAQAKSAADLGALEDAAGAILERARDNEGTLRTLAADYARQTGEARVSVLRLLGRIPGRESLEIYRAAVTSQDANLRQAALRGLSAWPDPAATPVLLDISRSATDVTVRTLALRGAIRLAGSTATTPAGQKAQVLAECLGLCGSADDRKAVLAALPSAPHDSALSLAVSCLGEPAVELEAANAVVRLAKQLQATHPQAAAQAIQKVLSTCKSTEARQLAENSGVVLGDMVNIAPQGVASSPDDLEKDGQAGGDQAAIDGNPQTYWDEADGAKLYRLVVTFAEPRRVSALSILGYQHHQFAPRDFEVLCDGVPVRKIENAQYSENLLVLNVPETSARAVELRITGYYGGSPAIRELGIFQKAEAKPAAFRVLVFSKTLGFRHSNIPLGVSAIQQLGAENGFAVEASEDSTIITPENLARYQAVVFLSATGDILNPAQEDAFRQFVLNGGGFVGIHGAMFGPSACEDKWAWYGEICCASFKNHSGVVPAQIDVEDRSNPSTLDLPARWSRTDEWYNYDGTPRGCARVLATLDESTYKGGTVGPDHPISWAKQVGKGIAWYTALGHTDESFREALFLKHVLGGIQLAAGAKKADLTPNQKPVR
jgi:type 1 glutamine amidotransferase/HEAT repeat protein